MAQRNNYQPDILSHLAEIVQKNTRAYTTDFDFDAKRLWDSAQETDMERRSFLWMCRLLGTWCVLEREVFLDDTNANCIWTHYADCPDGILAYRIVIEGIRDGKLTGRVIPIDYAAHFNAGASDGAENEMLLPGEIYCAAAITGSVAFGSAALASTAFVPQTPLVRVYPKTPRRITSQLGTQ